MRIEIKVPGGQTAFTVPVMKAQNYGIQEIFAKNLLFLIPFYIFLHEKRLKEYDENQEKLDVLQEEYREIMKRLDTLQREGKISSYTRVTILEMSGKVLEHLAKDYQNVREGVKAVMGGRILEYEAKTILKEGLEKGLEKGRLEQARETAVALGKMGMNEDMIAQAVSSAFPTSH